MIERTALTNKETGKKTPQTPSLKKLPVAVFLSRDHRQQATGNRQQNMASAYMPH